MALGSSRSSTNIPVVWSSAPKILSVFSSLMLRSYPAKQEGAISGVVLGTQIAVCFPFIPACGISMGLQLGNHKRKTK